MPPETSAFRAQRAELHEHNVTRLQGAHGAFPCWEFCLAPSSVGADTNRTTDMIEHNRLCRESTGQIDHVRNLRMVHPGIEGQTEPAKAGEPLSKGRVEVESGWRPVVTAANHKAVVACRRMTHAAKAASAGVNQRRQ